MNPYGNLGARQPEHDHLDLRRENLGGEPGRGRRGVSLHSAVGQDTDGMMTDAAVSHEYAGFELRAFRPPRPNGAPPGRGQWQSSFAKLKSVAPSQLMMCRLVVGERAHQRPKQKAKRPNDPQLYVEIERKAQTEIAGNDSDQESDEYANQEPHLSPCNHTTETCKRLSSRLYRPAVYVSLRHQRRLWPHSAPASVHRGQRDAVVGRILPHCVVGWNWCYRCYYRGYGDCSGVTTRWNRWY